MTPGSPKLLTFTFLKTPIAKFVALAVFLAGGNTYGSTLAATEFLDVAGSEQLPLYYVLFALVSIPVALGLARAIDRFSRLGLLLGLMAATAAVGATAATAVATDGHQGAAFALYLGISVLELLSYSIYFVLLADYFTALEVNRHTALVSTAMAAGGLVGGGLVWLGTRALPVPVLLYALAPLLSLAAMQAVWIGRSERAVDAEEPSQADEGFVESLRSFPLVMGRYPIALLIAAGVFLNQVTQCVTEFQVFTVYTEDFPDERALGGFLGLMNASLNLVGAVLSLGFTKPLIRHLGIGRMNLVFPAFMFLAFLWLSADLALPAAIFGHIVYDALAHSIDAPVFTANYNAISHRFVGRVRVFCDGIVYPVALAVSGAMLMLAQRVLDPFGISLLGAALALGFIAVGWGIGRLYIRGMLNLLRGGAVSLGTAAATLGQLPARYVGEIRAMLLSGDPRTQTLALELVARTDFGRFLDEIWPLLALARGDGARPLTAERLRGKLNAETLAAVRSRLSAVDAPGGRALALEILLGAEPGPSPDDLAPFLTDPAAEVAAIAAVGWAVASGDRAAFDRCAVDGPQDVRLAMIRAIRASREAAAPLLSAFVKDPAPPVRAATLEAAAVARPMRATVYGWARRGLEDPEPAVRLAAVRLLGASRDPADVAALAARLADTAEPVRAAAVDVLAGAGSRALAAVATVLAEATTAGPALDAAFAAAGRIGGRDAEALIAARLDAVAYRPIARNRIWRRVLPEAPRFAALRLALDDSDRRATDLVLHAVGALGHAGTVRLVRAALATGSERARANAIEALMGLAHRHLLLSLLPVLDPDDTGSGTRRCAQESRAILAEAAADPDPWLRRGAAFARDEPDDGGEIMSRLLFLRTVPLFAELSLDDLMSVDEVLVLEEYLADEAVITEGEIGDKLYLMQKGEALIKVAGREIARIRASEHFGEMAMFDYKPRSASVVTVTACSMLTLQRDRFRSLVAQRPNVLMHICRVFGERLRSMNVRVTSD